MSWFNTSNFSSLAKSAISQAQKSIDKVLDIQDDGEAEGQSNGNIPKPSLKSSPTGQRPSASRRNYKEDTRPRKEDGAEITPDQDSFFSSFLGSNKQSTPKTTKQSTPNSNQAGFEKLKLGMKDAIESPQKENSRSEKGVESLYSVSSDFILDSKRISRQNQSRSIEDDKSTGIASKKVESKVKKKEEFEHFKEFENDSISIADDKVKEDLLDDNILKVDNGCLVKEQGKEDISCRQERSILSASDMETDDLNQQNSANIETIVNQSVDTDFKLKEKSDRETLKSEEGLENKTTAKVENDIDDDEALEARIVGVAERSPKFVTENVFDGTAENTAPDQVSYLNSELPSSKLQSCSNSANPEAVSNAHKDNDIKNDTLSSDSLSVFEPARNYVSEPGELETQSETKQVLLNDSYLDLGNIDTSNIFKQKLELETGSPASRETAEQSKKSDEISDEIDGNAESKYESPSIAEDNLSENLRSVDYSTVKQTQQKEPSNLSNEIESIDSEGDAAKSSNLIESADLCEDNVDSAVTLHTPQKEDEEIVLRDQDSKKIKTLEMELERLQELVNARESKMVTLSKENIDMQEAVSILRNQLEQAEQASYGDESLISEMRDEFSKRMGEMNTKLNKVVKERDGLQVELDQTTERLTQSSDEMIRSYTNTLKEKEEQIAGLLAEGEALSKKELKSNTAVKKYRVKVKDMESKLEQNKKQLEDKDAEIAKLKETLKEKMEIERVMKDQVKKLEMITDQQEDEISKLKDQLDDTEDKIRGMQTTLDSGFQEINRLNLEKANRESEVEEIRALKLMKEELEKENAEKDLAAERERQHGVGQLESLRLTITRMEQTSARREDNFQQEIKELQQRLEEAENRNQELSQSIASASRPLLRQIENLQNSHHNQVVNWERVEKNLNDRLASAQQQLTLVADKERSAVDFAMEMKSRLTALELQVSSLRKQKEDVNNELVKCKDNLKTVEEKLEREMTNFQNYQVNYRTSLEELQNEKMFIENQLNAERAKHEAELIRLANESKAKGRLSRQNSSNAVQSVRLDSKSDEDVLETDGQPTNNTRSRTSSTSSSSNLIDSNNRNASTAVMEKLQTQMRQKDGEILVLKEEIVSLQKTRASLAQELVNLSNLVEELQDKVEKYDTMKENYQALESRYNAVLQLYGEKVEEADELRMDLEDVKQMYKQQIQQLFDER
eukprot:Seg3790.1 transcript_id=Seg3790.1/GoldUCD/mRNA.D3Y31 product="TATA element modulatory factor" protein_id=Seg3790.1/GoldUCD/D3Y31